MTERPPGDRGPMPRWAWLFLAGPVIWYLFFWVVYLGSEAGCSVGNDALVLWLTIGLSTVTIAAIAHYAWRAMSQRDEGEVSKPLLQAGYLMGGFFVVATIFVGLPAVVLQPC